MDTHALVQKAPGLAFWAGQRLFCFYSPKSIVLRAKVLILRNFRAKGSYRGQENRRTTANYHIYGLRGLTLCL